ncbi:MAG TPA: phosphatase PAP2 family protein [Burkholderiaceae bacterium]|nr:phosphatase PAP2 family protein [Burkholderiaceae bacterium]
MRSEEARFTIYKCVTGLGAAAAQSAVYFAVGHAQFARSTELLRTHLDDVIPFLPATAWLYLPFYGAIFAIAIAGFQTRAYFNRALVSVGFILAVGLVCHRFIPAVYPRPVLHPPYPDISYAFMAWVQRIDPPGNVFPSLHVAHTWALALIVHRENRRLGRVLIVMSALLALSTLTTKQHFVADVVSGLLLAVAARLLVLRGIDRDEASSPRPVAKTATDLALQ